MRGLLGGLRQAVVRLIALLERLVGRLPGAPPSEAPRCFEWEAWQDLMPGAGGTLHVRGTCRFPTAGYTAALRRQEPQGINPRDLLVVLEVTPPEGPAAQVATDLPVEYSEPVEPRQFDQVTILPNGPSLPVREVH